MWWIHYLGCCSADAEAKLNVPPAKFLLFKDIALQIEGCHARKSTAQLKSSGHFPEAVFPRHSLSLDGQPAGAQCGYLPLPYEQITNNFLHSFPFIAINYDDTTFGVVLGLFEDGFVQFRDPGDRG